eukprot:m.270370 g.270370  ORF g.270370 m.270370 type:complete len:224 (-) comp15680_c0_seq10:459-1130(-)
MLVLCKGGIAHERLGCSMRKVKHRHTLLVLKFCAFLPNRVRSPTPNFKPIIIIDTPRIGSGSVFAQALRLFITETVAGNAQLFLELTRVCSTSNRRNPLSIDIQYRGSFVLPSAKLCECTTFQNCREESTVLHSLCPEFCITEPLQALSRLKQNSELATDPSSSASSSFFLVSFSFSISLLLKRDCDPCVGLDCHFFFFFFPFLSSTRVSVALQLVVLSPNLR